MITPTDIRIAQHTIYDSGAAQAFREALAPKGRGRKPKVDQALYLVGMFLAAREHAQTHIRLIHKVLTQELPIDQQYAWEIRKSDPTRGPDKEWVISEADLQNISRTFKRALSYGVFAPDEVQQDQPALAERKQTLESIIDLIITSTHTPRPTGATTYAIDDSGIWASERSRKKIHDTEIHEGDEETTESNEPEEDITSTQPATQTLAKSRKGRNQVSDASYGAKTDKNGQRKYYFGYALHALVRVPDDHAEGLRAESALVERFRLTPAGTDVVDVSLDLIDTVRKTGQKIEYLLADRHYSYKRIHRWLYQLIDRNIEQVVQLRAPDQGFTEWDGMLFTAGHAHCPATPQNLGAIPQPGFDATDAEWGQFFTRIHERMPYAAQKRSPLNTEGESRWSCPALNGSVGCPLRPGTLKAARTLNLPIIHNPPKHPPSICTQKSVGLKIATSKQAVLLKSHQRHYWGSRKQMALAGRRTFVEGFFGVLKGDTAAAKRRGSSLYTGIAHAALEAAVFAAIANIISLRAWHRETELGDPNHPILAADIPVYGFRYLAETEQHPQSDQPQAS